MKTQAKTDEKIWTADQWDAVNIRVERIANGFLVIETKCLGYKEAQSKRLFYPSMESVEAELLFRLRAVIALDPAASEENF